MYSCLFATLLNQFRNRPCARFNASRLRWGHADGAMSLAEVIIREIQRHRSLKVFNFLAERIGETGKASAMHPQGVVLLFNVRSGDAGNDRLPGDNRLFDL